MLARTDAAIVAHALDRHGVSGTDGAVVPPGRAGLGKLDGDRCRPMRSGQRRDRLARRGQWHDAAPYPPSCGGGRRAARANHGHQRWRDPLGDRGVRRSRAAGAGGGVRLGAVRWALVGRVPDAARRTHDGRGVAREPPRTDQPRCLPGASRAGCPVRRAAGRSVRLPPRMERQPPALGRDAVRRPRLCPARRTAPARRDPPRAWRCVCEPRTRLRLVGPRAQRPLPGFSRACPRASTACAAAREATPGALQHLGGGLFRP